MRRYFLAELEQKLRDDSQTLLLKPPEPMRLVRDAGYIQGLKAAMDLYEEIERHNRQRDDNL